MNEDFQKSWVDQSNDNAVDFEDMTYEEVLNRPIQLLYVRKFSWWIGISFQNLAEDVQYFIPICKRPRKKPVTFVPALDDEFEIWFKKDYYREVSKTEWVSGFQIGTQPAKDIEGLTTILKKAEIDYRLTSPNGIALPDNKT